MEQEPGLRELIQGLASEMNRQFASIDAQFTEVREHLGRHDAQFADLRLHFDITAEGVRHEIGILAESVGGMATKESVENLRDEMRAEFEDVRVEIRASYASLDRRIGKPR
jgi:HAMP domain-containing protein